MTHRLRSWFLRGALEAIERQHGPAGIALLTERVPRRLVPHASLDRLRASAALDTILLDDGEELLLSIENLLGDGTGRVLEQLGHELALRALNQGGVAKFGDLYGTVARLQAFLDHPFVDTPTLFELRRTNLGFGLTVGVLGRPRSTRVLNHLALGAIRAAERTVREPNAGLQLTAELFGDRAHLTARYLRVEPLPAARESDPPPTSVRRPTQSTRPPAHGSLSQEVERILASARAQSAPPESLPAQPPSARPARPRSTAPSAAPQASERRPTLPPRSLATRTSPAPASTQEPESEVQPVAPRVAAHESDYSSEPRRRKV